MNLLLSLLCTLFLLASASEIYADSLPAEQIMTPHERESMGYDKLSPQEQRAFEQWAARWTHHVLQEAPTYRSGENLSSWVQRWPAYANPTKTQLSPEEISQRAQSNQVVDRIRKNGEYIDLKDGSSWHISPFFRYLTSQWQRNQPVEVKKGNNVLHPWVLNNITMDQSAEADMAQAPSATGRRAPEPAEYYKGALSLVTVNGQGDLLSLSDGSIWKVAPTDMYKARNWAANDRIRVEPSNNFLYTFNLTNLDTGEVALANPKQ